MQEDEIQQFLAARRDEIDAIDRQILDLLSRRADMSLAVERFKRAHHVLVYDLEREEEIIDKVRAANPGPFYDDHVADIWRAILRHSRSLVGYIG